MANKICKICGKEFNSDKQHLSVCGDKHFRKCAICGKEFELNYKKGTKISDLPKTCSKECATKLKFKNGNPFSDHEKMMAAYKAKTGYDHPMHDPKIQQKVKDTTKERYGVEHFVQSEQYIESAIKTNREKYGTDWAMQSAEVQQKSRDTLQKHYSVDNPMQSEKICDKYKKKYKESTGYENPFSNPEIKKKIADKNLQMYGTENPLGNKEVREKAKKTMLDRYGVDNPMKNKDILQKAESTSLERYGSKSFLSSESGRERLKSAMREKYNMDWYSQTREWKSEMVSNPDNLDCLVEFENNPIEFLHKNYDKAPTLQKLMKDLGVGSETISRVLNQFDCRDLVAYYVSTMETDVISVLKDIDPSICIKQHDRSIIYPYEIDILLPDYNIGIECNPTATHNSSKPFMGVGDITLPGYHLMKTKMCEDNGIFLFHIFGYEWTYKRDIIISMLRNLLGKNTDRLYARNLIVRSVDSKESRKFLNKNHRQGYVYAKYNYGLYTENGELVSLMTFGNMRKTIGAVESSTCGSYELVRFCSRLNTTVIGGASKLFAHFIKKISPKEVRSFSDRAHTKGNLYQTLGFTKSHCSNPGYVWICESTDIPYHRTNAQKRKIKKFLKDDSIDLLNYNERQIMESHGFVRMFDCGTVLWVLNIG